MGRPASKPPTQETRPTPSTINLLKLTQEQDVDPVMLGEDEYVPSSWKPGAGSIKEEGGVRAHDVEVQGGVRVHPLLTLASAPSAGAASCV